MPSNIQAHLPLCRKITDEGILAFTTSKYHKLLLRQSEYNPKVQAIRHVEWIHLTSRVKVSVFLDLLSKDCGSLFFVLCLDTILTNVMLKFTMQQIRKSQSFLLDGKEILIGPVKLTPWDFLVVWSYTASNESCLSQVTIISRQSPKQWLYLWPLLTQKHDRRLEWSCTAEVWFEHVLTADSMLEKPKHTL